jgi:tRNA(Ile)-lysidine synthase
MSMSLTTELKATIAEKSLFDKNDGLLIAVSGGMDSMCLLFAINELHKGVIEVAHMNYHLRGMDSDKDEKLVKRICNDLNIKCHTNDEPLIDKSSAIQESARVKRYNWLENLLQDRQLDYIITAHHRDDQFETILHHLVRGSGIKGLNGMDYKTNRIIRPFLDIPKSSIEEYQKSNNIPYREDTSNRSSKYTRNFIRNEVLPLLNNYFQNFEAGFETSIRNIKSEYSLLNTFLHDYSQRNIYSKNAFIHLPLSNQTNPSIITSLLVHLLDHKIQMDEVRQLIEAKQAGTILHKEEFSILKDRHELIIRPYLFEPIELEIRKPGVYKLHKGYLGIEKVDNAYISSNPYSAYVCPPQDFFPLLLRNWQKGDAFPPLGMKGQMKKLSDLFIDDKLHQFEKEEIPILTYEDDIIWVVGMRINDHYKVKENSDPIYKLSYSRRSKDFTSDFFDHLF